MKNQNQPLSFTEQLHGKDFADKLAEIKSKLSIIEEDYRKSDSSFKIDKYWMYNIPNGGKASFFTTSNCKDESLKNSIYAVFSEVLNPS